VAVDVDGFDLMTFTKVVVALRACDGEGRKIIL
jgi:hypothetical protein